MRSLCALGCSLVLVLSACNTRETTSDKQARVRNQPPATCTQQDFAVCPEIAFESCPDGQEPVIDYGSDCCPIFSCQPLCIPDGPCNVGPAPFCPAGTKLWIGTALEDCCPAYRCEPDVQCDSERMGPCPLAMPYCGNGIEPIVVGYTPECCPIFQCPCDVPVPADGREGGDVVVSNPDFCGCTYAACPPGTQLVCKGDGVCGYPCECVPMQGECFSDADCPQPGCDPNDPTTNCTLAFRCDTSVCLPPPGCDPSTGMACPAVCAGICVANTTWGCRSDMECPFGQRCEMQCAGWACAFDPANPEPCVCPPDLAGCTCDPNGMCYGEECFGVCVPAPVCDGTCAAPRCPDAKEVGVDQCGCPIFQCGVVCDPTNAPCPPPPCPNGIPVGTDPNCCPMYCCPDATGTCPEPRPL